MRSKASKKAAIAIKEQQSACHRLLHYKHIKELYSFALAFACLFVRLRCLAHTLLSC